MKKYKVKKVIIFIIISFIIIGGSYIGTYYMDKFNDQGTANLKVVFDDTNTYQIPNVNKLTKEKALEEWPYMFTVSNSGDKKALYQIIIKDIEANTLERKNLHYLLMLDEKEVQEGLLSDISNDILYTGSIKKNTEQRYKLYIWQEDVEDTNLLYEYQLSFNAINDGGPGF